MVCRRFFAGTSIGGQLREEVGQAERFRLAAVLRIYHLRSYNAGSRILPAEWTCERGSVDYGFFATVLILNQINSILI